MHMRGVAWCLVLFLTACAEKIPSTTLTPTSYHELPYWQSDNHQAALAAFKQSCEIWEQLAGDKSIGCNELALNVSDWRDICNQAVKVDNISSRQFFETYFKPFHISVNGSDEGLFTGYYIPEIQGSLTRSGSYQTPVYTVPSDLKKDVPYYSRAQINAGSLEARNLEIAWTDDPVALFFMQIQGSGVMRLTSGELIRLGFAGKNHHPYIAIGRIMRERGLLDPDNINLFTIKQWLYNHPDQAQAMMEENPSYIFFRKLEDAHIRGAQNAPLTPERSLAIDKRYIPYGFPVYLQTELPKTDFGPPKPFRQLMIAQDTGSAIRGAIRGDIYFGYGKHAEALAGHMAAKGRYTLLLPNKLAKRVGTNISVCGH